MGVVWHGHYLKYFELARTSLFKYLNLAGQFGKTSPYVWVVIESRVRHTAPLRFDDPARVTAQLVDIDHRVRLRYEICNLTTGIVSAKGHTDLATLDQKGNMLLETPFELRQHLTMQGSS
jgi:acyl-CoA thioester hydrolase